MPLCCQRLVTILLLALASSVAAQDRTDFEAEEAHLVQSGDLVVLGTPRAGTSTQPLTVSDYPRLLAGGYRDKTFEIDCLPFLVEAADGSGYRIWAFPTDETGYGWDEDHPIILVSDQPIALEDRADRIRVLGTWVPDTSGWLPQFRLLAGYVHDASD